MISWPEYYIRLATMSRNSVDGIRYSRSNNARNILESASCDNLLDATRISLSCQRIVFSNYTHKHVYVCEHV